MIDPTEAPAGWQLDFVERVAARAELGLPLSLVRTLAWLVVCEPSYQSAEQLQERLQVSAGSVSAATSTLVRAGVLTRRTLAGDRRMYYELDPEGWRRLLAGRLETLEQVRRVADETLLLDSDNGRLRSMRDLLVACEVGLAPVLGDGGARRKRTKARKKGR
ncbi:MAG: GbsR/MarR family transcriptional regulator [Actinomycetota bacterium]